LFVTYLLIIFVALNNECMYKKSLKEKILDDAYKSFKDIISEYSEKNNISESDKDLLYRLILKAYLDKKMQYFLEDKLSDMSSYLDFALNFALQNDNKDIDKSNLNIFYVKHLKKSLVSNE
jgi:uncharacterized protein YktA (UPF0223 family)